MGMVTILLFVFCVVCTVTDFRRGKVYNALTFPSMLVGLMAHIVIGGFQGATFSLLGMGAALILFFPFFALKIMGAGDVKMLMAIGALKGAAFALNVAILSIFVGGMISFFILLYKGRLLQTITSIGKLLRSIIVSELEYEPIPLERCMMAPFAISITVAVFLTQFNVLDVSWLWIY
ncbi:MAG: prepilin peptidase [Deltaproteobacteria bacterium]|nr:prepilin peptidase [Deltaproteobacteria bacterium]